MIDEDDDIQAVLDAALRDTGAVDERAKGAVSPSQAADEGDESEMTSVMGPEERQLLQQATRRGQEAAASEVVRDEESARPTARPPGSGNEQPVLIVGPVSPVVRQRDRHPRHISLDWSVVAFILLAAAALYEVQCVRAGPPALLTGARHVPGDGRSIEAIVKIVKTA